MQYKLLYLDFDAPSGHVVFNKIWLKELGACPAISLTVCMPTAYRRKFVFPAEVKIIDIPDSLQCGKGGFHWRLFSILRFLWIRRRISLKTYDIVLIASFDSFSLFFATLFLKKSCYLVCHNNIAKALENSANRYFFRKLTRRHTMLVFEDYMRERLQSSLGCSKIAVVHHGFPPAFEIKQAEEAQPDWLMQLRKTHKTIFVPSVTSTSSEFKKFLSENSEFQEFLHCNHIIIIIRTAEQQENTNNIIYLYNRLSDAEYSSIFMMADLILLPYSSHFNHRVSAVLLEAFANRKKLLLPTLPVFTIYHKYLSKYCFFDNYAALPDAIMKQLQTETTYISDFEPDMKSPDFTFCINNI